MQRFAFALIAFLCASTSTAGVSEPRTDANDQLYYHSHIFAYSETSSIKQIVVDDMEGPYFDGGEHSFTHNVWELGVTRAGWKLAYLIRYDYSLDYNPDTAALVYSDKNDLSIEKNRIYDVDMQLIHTRTNGLKVGYDWQVTERFNFQLDATYLETSRLLEGKVTGQFEVANDDYMGQLDLDYVYSKDELLERAVENPNGRGYAIDIAWDWQINSRYRLAGKWTDLFSKITFNKAPFTTAAASTDRINFDDEGKIDVKPVLSGREGFRKHYLRFPRQMNLGAYYQFQPEIELTAGWYRYGTIDFASLGLTYASPQDIALHSRFDFKSDALTLGLITPLLNVAITSDRLVFKKARTFGLDLAFRVRF